jgi:hypothetical protein
VARGPEGVDAEVVVNALAEVDGRDAVGEVSGDRGEDVAAVERAANRLAEVIFLVEMADFHGVVTVVDHGEKTVVRADKKDPGLFQTIEVAPSVDLSRIEEFLILQTEKE